MQKPTGHSRFTLEERKSIVKEYVESALSASELCKKYGIGAPTTLYTWRSQLQESKKKCTFATEMIRLMRRKNGLISAKMRRIG